MARSVPPPAMEPAGKDPFLGAAVSEHIILERYIASGGMSIVYATRAVEGHPARAIKLLKHEFLRSGEATRRFEREAAILVELGEHENILSIIEYGTAKVPPFDGMPYIVMPLVRGKTVEDIFEEIRGHDDALRSGGLPGRFPLEYTVFILGKMCAALIAAHEHPQVIIHRDVKPSNVFVEEQRGTTRVMLADFGIARYYDPQAFKATFTEFPTIVGTPDFMAPEQAAGDRLTPAADVYAVGVMAYEMFCGRLPLSMDVRGSVPTTEEVNNFLRRIITVAPPALSERLPTCNAMLNELVMQCLAKRPGDRPTIREFRDRLSAATAQQINRSVYPSSGIPGLGLPSRMDLTPPGVPLDLPVAPASKPPTVSARVALGSGESPDEAKTLEWSGRSGNDDAQDPNASSRRMSAAVFITVAALVLGGLSLLALTGNAPGSTRRRSATATVADAGRAERDAGAVRVASTIPLVIDPSSAERDAGRPRLVTPPPPATAPPDPAVAEHQRLCRAELAESDPTAGWMAHCEVYLEARCATETGRPLDCRFIQIRVDQIRDARRREERLRRERERELEPEPEEDPPEDP